MVGIVGILLLGSLAWSAVGALVSAIGAAGSALTSAASPRPVATFETSVTATPAPTPSLASTPLVSVTVTSPTVEPTIVATATASAEVALTPTLGPTSVPSAVVAGRNPWILLPQPEPGSKVSPGQITLEARGRGDAPITGIALELDGGALPVQLEQRSESTWRAFASTRVSTGSHNVRATVTDANGRSGSFRWSFTVG